MPPPMTTTSPGATPGTPPSRSPRPPSGFSRKVAPACAASRPAISLIGASSGRARSSVSTVSYATHAAPLSISARVSSSLAARCRYVNRTCPSRRRPYSSGSGGGVRRIGEGASQAGTPLDEDAVPTARELERAGGSERDAILVGLDLARNADVHRARLCVCEPLHEPALLRTEPRPL